MKNKQKGVIGEILAEKYLISHSYKILEKNYRCKWGEIDIIVEDSITKELVIVEVKARTSMKYGRPIEAINSNKRNHIKAVTKYYLYTKKRQKSKIRFDIIEVYLSKKNCHIYHWKNQL